MKELVIPATKENLEQVTAFVEGELEAIECPIKTTMQILVAVEEIYINIASYAYSPEVGTATITFDVHDTEEGKEAEIGFYDQGIPFNPLEKEDPDVNKKAEDRSIGGLGIFMVKNTMDEFTYEYKDGKNTVKIVKNF